MYWNFQKPLYACADPDFPFPKVRCGFCVSLIPKPEKIFPDYRYPDLHRKSKRQIMSKRSSLIKKPYQNNLHTLSPSEYFIENIEYVGPAFPLTHKAISTKFPLKQASSYSDQAML
jgi:hypothetical protein